MKLSFFKYCLISFLLVIPLLVNLYWWHWQVLGLLLGLVYFVFYGLIVGSILFKNESLIFQLLAGIFALISSISFFGVLIYLFYELNTHVIALIITFIPLLICKKEINLKKLNLSINEERPNKIFYCLEIIYCLLSLILFVLLFQNSTKEAIRTPWEVIPTHFLLIYFLATFTLLGIIFKNKSGPAPLFIIIHTFLSLSLVLIIYPLGYGFDSFIHQATEKIIIQEGFINPKPFYYLGQYSLVVFLSQLFQTYLVTIDKLLVPIFAAIFLPLVFCDTLSKSFAWPRKTVLILSLFLFLPFETFIVTTPYALASLYLLITILISYQYLEQKKLSPPYSSSLSPSFPELKHLFFLNLVILVIHPLVGIPSLILTLLISILQIKTKKIKKLLIIISSLIMSFFIPLVFFFNFLLSESMEINFLVNFSQIFNWQKLIPQIPAGFHLIKNLVYLYENNLDFLFLLLVLVGISILIYHKKFNKFFAFVLVSLILFINYLILKLFFNFSSLIIYERNDYPERLLFLISYFLLPFFLIPLGSLFKKILNQPLWLKFSFLFLWSIFITFSLYLSYPRHDNYGASRQFSVSSSDIKAVHFIEKNALGDDYIVLANQSVSAAAIKEFGFKKYYELPDKKLQFYYPLPTGSPLYNYYLEMVYNQPDQETAKEAMSLVGVQKLYLVVNEYWHEADKIIKLAKTTARDWTIIDEGKIWVFKYNLLR